MLVSKFLFSSPVREGKSSRKLGRQHIKRVAHQAVSDSSDKEDSRFTSQPSGSRLSDKDVQLSTQFLKPNDATQRKVQKQLLKLQGQGAMDNAVKLEIPWPHHHCFPSSGVNLPKNKDLSPSNFSLDSWATYKRNRVTLSITICSSMVAIFYRMLSRPTGLQLVMHI